MMNLARFWRNFDSSRSAEADLNLAHVRLGHAYSLIRLLSHQISGIVLKGEIAGEQSEDTHE
jgi:hypothetical protein